MKLICTLLVRDEIDIIKPWMDYHLPKFDEIIVTDNKSVDGTRKALDKFPVTVIDEPGRDYRQDRWVDRMVRLAIERGADWIVNSDADEFWLGDIKKLVKKHHGDFNALFVQSRNFCTTWEDRENNDPTRRLIYHAGITPMWQKMVFRADAYGEAYLGNHRIFFKDGVEPKEKIIDPAEAIINHYNERGWTHYRRKYIQGGEAYRNNRLDLDPRYGKSVGWHWKEKYQVYCRFGIEGLRREFEKSIRESRELTREPLHD